ncbi:MAG: CoA transferase [Dehalococcoidia bacterium]|nr:CoA transferase [Dehalococcoidia bacterium]MDW8009603.1 CoA transferase [Chloroflexota bacterium]
MAGPLEGIKVVELAFWVAGPSCAAILADWGAEVIKLEPPNGDPFRGLFASALGLPAPVNPPFEQDNRGKRSLALDLGHEQGRRIAYRLLERADVFVTNLRPRALADLGLSYEELSALNPRLVYCHISGYGTDHEERDRAAYDVGAFWSRGAVAAMLMSSDGPPPQQRGGMGDHMAGQSAAGAVAAALFHRERTGRGQKVSVSLMRIGAYMMSWDIALASRLGAEVKPYDRFHHPNPLINCYRAGDGRWFWLLLLQADRHWPDLCRAIGRPDLMEDPRFANIEARRLNAPELVEELDRIFAQRTLAEWGEVFDREDVWWAPVQDVNDLVKDPMADKAGVFVPVPTGDGQQLRLVASPADFHGTPWQVTRPVPELGQHTEEVLLELGYDWEQIVALKEAGVIP